MKKLNPFFVGAFLLGFTAITNQIILLRECLISFYGNELATGIVLGGWFFWTGLGAWLSRFLEKDLLGLSYYWEVI